MSDRVVVLASIPVKPDAVDEAEAHLRKLVDGVRGEEGAIEYTVHREGDGPTFWVYEVYADQAAFDAHGKNPALGEFFGAIGPLLDGRPGLHIVRPIVGK